MTDQIKIMFNIPDILKPEVRLPARAGDCPAAPICESIGNLRDDCLSGAGFGATMKTEKCMAGIILLISRLTGMWPPPMVESVEKGRQPIGFAAPQKKPGASGKE
jgi:hypothetical protein